MIVSDEAGRSWIADLQDHHWADVVKIVAWQLAPRDEDAEDVAQEAFIVAWQKWQTDRPSVPDDPLPWLIGIARNLAKNHRRKLLRQLSLFTAVGHLRPRQDGGHAVELRHDLRRGWERLSQREQLVLRLFFDNGNLTCAQVAKIVGGTDDNIRQIRHRARAKLRSAMEQLGGGHLDNHRSSQRRGHLEARRAAISGRRPAGPPATSQG